MEWFFPICTIDQRNAILNLIIKITIFYVHVSVTMKAPSINYKSDAQIYKKVRNKWLAEDLDIRKEITEKATIKYEAQIIDQNVVYEVVGELPEEEFSKISREFVLQLENGGTMKKYLRFISVVGILHR